MHFKPVSWDQFRSVFCFGLGAGILLREVWPQAEADPWALITALTLMGYAGIDRFVSTNGKGK